MPTIFTEINRIFSDALVASNPNQPTEPITDQEIKEFFKWFANK